jgi:signal transduction histidine kinase
VPARVLLADDTADIRTLLRIVLSRHEEFEVVAEAADGSEAVAAAGTCSPDLVLLDLAMPVMDGLEAIPGLRAAAPDCKIVVLSGFNAGQMAKEALHVGADAYVEKGTPPGRLVQELRRVLGLRLDVDEPEAAGEPTSAGAVMTAEPVASAPVGWSGDDLALVTHELLSPLAVIEGFSALLDRRADAFEPAQVQEQASTILRSARHLRAMLRTVTDVQRMEAGALAVTPSVVDVAELVRDAVRDADVLDGHPTRVDAPDGLEAVLDSGRVHQALLQLLSNAATYSPAGSAIDIEVRAAGDDVVIAVRDRGRGIPVEQRHELFGRFSRLGTTGKGLGLGLYLARGIARAHGGDVVLEEVPAGEPGCRFVVRLPRRLDRVLPPTP